MIKVLLVEDDSVIARIIRFYLEQESKYEVVWAKTSGEALAHAKEYFDVILMDVLLPDVDGIELCARMREWQSCPVIFISCLDNSDTIVSALEAGGDDFITKPFDNKVLAAHIEANIRRASQTAPEIKNNNLVCKGFILDVAGQAIVKDDRTTRLSPHEFQILHFLMLNQGRYFSADELFKRIWKRESFGDNRCVIVHIHNIRQKIGDAGKPRFLKNVWGKGYVFDPLGQED